MSRYWWSWFHLAAGALLLLGGAPARAQSTDGTVRELQKQIAELQVQVKALEAANQQKDRNLQVVDQRIKVLDRKVEVQQETQRDFTRELPKVDFNYKDQGGLTLKTEDGANRFTVGGWMQADGRYYTTQSPGAASTFLMRRVRPYFEGTIDKYYDFNVMIDFGQGQTLLENAYADIHYFPEFRLQAGKFKEPASLERWQDDRWNEFAERALPVNLVPDRDIGAQFHGQLWHDLLEYHLGVFNGSTDNSAASDFAGHNGKEFSGRIFVKPFATYSNERLQGFGLGVAGTYETSDKNIPLDTYKTAAQNVFFQYNKNAFPAGNRYRFAPQFYYYTGPFGLLGDFVYNSQELGVFNIVKGVATSKTRQISNYAWAITGNYVLTGEEAAFDGINPRHPFDPRIGSWGAFELVARVEQLVADQDAFNDGFANPATSAGWALGWGVGFNWWLSRRFKLQTDYVRTTFHHGAPNGDTRKPESAFLQELQILF
jgi:phosphate-selective porin OprO/OprP